MNMLLMGYYGARNLGDEMMLFCLLKWLKRQGVGVTLLCEGSSEAAERFGVPAIENLPLLLEWSWVDVWLRRKAFRLLRQFRTADGLIVGGGDLIRDDRGWRTYLFAVEKILLAIFLRKPVFLLNVGIGTPATWYGRRLTGWSLRRCRQIVVRDLRSLAICGKAGAQASLAPDIVTNLPAWIEGWRTRAAPSRPYIAVCLRATSDAFGQFRLEDGGLLNLSRALDRLAADRGLDIVFVPFQALSAEGENDNDIHVEVAKRMRERSRVVIREWTGDLAEVTRCIAGASCVIAMRLHAAILAAACGRRCAVMPYDYKVSEAARMFKIPNQITPHTLANFPELTRVLDQVLDQALDSDGEISEMASWDSLALRLGGADKRD